MKHIKATISFGALTAWAMSAGLAHADLNQDQFMKSCLNAAKSECKKTFVQGGGDGFPRGLGANDKVELAVGEQYLLSGTVDILRNDAYLAIDLESHPWLGSARRKANPYYRISDDVTSWKKLKQRRVLLLATAQGAIWANGEDRYSYEIMLVPVEPPVVDPAKPARIGR